MKAIAYVPIALCLAAASLAGENSQSTTPPPTPPSPTATPAAERKSSGGVPLEGVFRNGFVLRTPDGTSELRLAASFQLDSRSYFGDSVAPDSFDIRRARLDVNAKVFDFMTVRIQAAMEDNPYIRNAYLDLGRDKAVNLRIGQMKVPFSTNWLTLDNQVNFIERGTAEPLYPFFDRGLMLWGNVARDTLTYQLGVYNGTGVDVEGSKGDVDDHKDAALRLFYQPFRHRDGSPLEGLYLVGEGTYGLSSVATRRFETRGLMAANYESLLWRWRADQVLGSDGRNSDVLVSEIDSRTRVGAEVLYLRGPLTLSAEWLEARWDGIAVYHDAMAGSSRRYRELVLQRDGAVRSLSLWGSYYLTGERKLVDASGWRQPNPLKPFTGKGSGTGAFEVLARYSRTRTDPELFDAVRVTGFSGGVGEGNVVTAAVLQGSADVRELTVGLNWMLNYYFRVIFDVTTITALDFEDGQRGIVSGGNSELGDPTRKGRLVETEHMAAVRFIVRI